MYQRRFSESEELRLQGGSWCFSGAVMTACRVQSGGEETVCAKARFR